MSVLLERPEISSFISGWKNKPQEQVAEELASYSLETKRIADPYYFLISKEGELISPTAHCKVKDTVADKTGPLGKPEYEALLAIEEWAARNNEGSAVWVSPPAEGVYPVSKIIISQIEQNEGTKRLFNRAILLDYDEKQCLEFAQNLAKFSQNRPLLSSLNEVRSTPLFLKSHGNSWIYILQELIDDPEMWEGIKNGEDQRAKKEALRQAVIVQKGFSAGNNDLIEANRAVMRMLGDKPGSCPSRISSGTAFQSFSGSALSVGRSSSLNESDQYGSLEFDCPKCKAVNRRPRGKLIPNCQNCKSDVRC